MIMKTVIKAMLAGLILTGAAAAQQIEWNEKPEGYKSPSTAVSYSMAGTFVPAGIGLLAARSGGNSYFAGAMIGTGFILGPGAGYIYGGESGRGIKRALGRTVVGGTFFALGFLLNESSDSGNEPDAEFSPVPEIPAGVPFLLIGGAFVVIHAVYDITVVDNHVRKHNEKIMGETQGGIAITPMYFADSGAAGMSLSITF
jgi:uncharacterized membrane protein YgdD (TMEM256/DUF423 family)